jgi:hypothetical protein
MSIEVKKVKSQRHAIIQGMKKTWKWRAMQLDKNYSAILLYLLVY